MNICSLELAAWAVVAVLCVSSRAVTVKDSELKLCNDARTCVTDLKDCGPVPPTATIKTLNMSCFYQLSASSMSCDWSQESNSPIEADVSLIFSSDDEIFSCQGIFNPLAILDVTLRINDTMMRRQTRSKPHTVDLWESVKPLRPVLTLRDSSSDSLGVSWRSDGDKSCRLRYRIHDTQTWNQVSDSVPAQLEQTVFTIKDLLPFTVYTASVSCRYESGSWSDWSSEITGRTQDRPPSSPPDVCYRVEKRNSDTRVLHLMWKALDLHEAGGRILGYQVSHRPAKEEQESIRNVTELMALQVVEEGNCNVTVRAFNAAGYGPAAHLSISTHDFQNPVSSVRHLWASSFFPDNKSLLIQWDVTDSDHHLAPPTNRSSPVSHYAIQWRSEKNPPTSRWDTADGFATSAVIQDHLDPDQTYMISVFPVFKQHCGCPQSLPASLQHGALMEVANLRVVGVTKATVTVMWAWQRKTGPSRVNGYRVMLRKDSENQTLSVWPDQQQHTFFHLKPNTDYSVLLLVDNVSSAIIAITTTAFDEAEVAVTATPLLLLAVTVATICVLSRTAKKAAAKKHPKPKHHDPSTAPIKAPVSPRDTPNPPQVHNKCHRYKSYFFPYISSPRNSLTGKWLMDTNHQKTEARGVLAVDDFTVTDVLLVNGITLEPKSKPDSEEVQPENTSLLQLSHVGKFCSLNVDTEYISNALPSGTTQHQPVSLQSYDPDYKANGLSQEGGAALWHSEPRGANGQLTPPPAGRHSKQREVSAPSLQEEPAEADCCGLSQTSCEVAFALDASFTLKSDVAMINAQENGSYLIYEADYVTNNCMPAKAAAEKSSNTSVCSAAGEENPSG